jgi:hypothetical protein
MTEENEGLARMAGFFSDMEIDRDDYPLQHADFADHCALAIAAIMIAACVIGMTWSLYLFPLWTLAVWGLSGCALVGVDTLRRRS